MFLASFPAGPWQANCYVFAADDERAVVIDPGVGALPTVQQVVAEHALRVEGVLLSHGHLDHVASAADVADHFGVPAWIHADDRELLTWDGPHSEQAHELGEQLGVHLAEPADLRLWQGGEHTDVAGMRFDVVHAPGHRPGCVLLRHALASPLADAPDVAELVFSGDVLFAGSIGRTDLAGGDDEAMRRTLRDVVLPLPEAAVVLPGHGPQTTMAQERATNPYLTDSYLR